MHTAFAFAVVFLLVSPAQAATVFTGDKVQGVPVISQLDVGDLESGKTHRFMFQGDELNPLRVAVQKVFADLDATKPSGSVIGIVGPSRSGVEHVTRMWPVSNLGVNLINPNRT